MSRYIKVSSTKESLTKPKRFYMVAGVVVLASHGTDQLFGRLSNELGFFCSTSNLLHYKSSLPLKALSTQLSRMLFGIFALPYTLHGRKSMQTILILYLHLYSIGKFILGDHLQNIGKTSLLGGWAENQRVLCSTCVGWSIEGVLVS